MAEFQWFYAREAVQFGPVGTGQLRQLAAAGQLAPEDLVWREGMADWAPASRVRGLFPEGKGEPPESPVSPPEVPPELIRETLPVDVPPSVGTSAGAAPFDSPLPTPISADEIQSIPTATGPRLPLARVLAMVQAGLWALCLGIVLVGGLALLAVVARGNDPQRQTSTAAIFAALAVGGYVLARSVERGGAVLTRLLEERSRR